MTKKKKQYYVVVNGRQPGIYTSWYGDEGAADQVDGLSDAIFKGFYARYDALAAPASTATAMAPTWPARWAAAPTAWPRA